MSKHDVVVIGGGHYGLTVAAYLAKAGLDVCVVEKQGILGGASCTQELTLPGFKHDPGATIHIAIQANPLIHRDELGLKSKYGLKYIYTEESVAFVFPDTGALVFYRDIDKTCQSIAQISKRDAEIYPKFIENSLKAAKAGGPAMFSPAVPFGRLVSFADSTEEGRGYLKILFSSMASLAEEWFESEYMKIALCRWSGEVMMQPQIEGTGPFVLGFAHFHRWGGAFPEGGSGMLSEALAACIRDNGGAIRLSSPVKTIKVENGEAKGVILESGEEITAKKAVVPSLHVKQLFLDMLRPDELPPDFQTKVRHLRHSPFTAMNQSIALNEAPKYKAGGDVNRTTYVNIVPSSLEELLRPLEEYSYGIPCTKHPTIVVETLADPSRAPQGKHTLYLYHFEPYNLKEGGAAKWDEIKQEIADGILESMRKHTTNMGEDNILGRYIMSPLDIERWNPTLVQGDIMHLGGYVTQTFSNRPLPGWGQYRTPIKKLYMCGASTHPGGGVTGGGRATVQVIMEDLGIDFKKVIAK
ncbi:phytoene desaturase family protein [Chloroflexota bacterium]